MKLFGDFWENVYICTKIRNYKQIRLCLFLVCVAEESSQRIGLGGYAISAATAFALHVFPVINAPNVHGDG